MISREFLLVTKAKELIERVISRRAAEESRARATETAMRFAGQPNQEPAATFTSDSDATFDLNKIPPGSIFRVRYEGNENQFTFHRWFAAGDRMDTKLPIYEIVFGAHPDNRSHARLTLTPGLHVTQIRPRQLEFHVNETHEALGEERRDNTFVVNTIDLMAGGISQRAHETDRVGMCNIQLEQGVRVPVPVT